MNRIIVDSKLEGFKKMVNEEDIKFDAIINDNKENYKIFKEKAKLFEEHKENDIS